MRERVHFADTCSILLVVSIQLQHSPRCICLYSKSLSSCSSQQWYLFSSSSENLSRLSNALKHNTRSVLTHLDLSDNVIDDKCKIAGSCWFVADIATFTCTVHLSLPFPSLSLPLPLPSSLCPFPPSLLSDGSIWWSLGESSPWTSTSQTGQL